MVERSYPVALRKVEKIMAKSDAFVFTKSELNKIKASDGKMTDARKRAVSKALVEANSAANTPKKKKA